MLKLFDEVVCFLVSDRSKILSSQSPGIFTLRGHIAHLLVAALIAGHLSPYFRN